MPYLPTIKEPMSVSVNRHAAIIGSSALCCDVKLSHKATQFNLKKLEDAIVGREIFLGVSA